MYASFFRIPAPCISSFCTGLPAIRCIDGVLRMDEEAEAVSKRFRLWLQQTNAPLSGDSESRNFLIAKARNDGLRRLLRFGYMPTQPLRGFFDDSIRRIRACLGFPSVLGIENRRHQRPAVVLVRHGLFLPVLGTDVKKGTPTATERGPRQRDCTIQAGGVVFAPYVSGRLTADRTWIRFHACLQPVERHAFLYDGFRVGFPGGARGLTSCSYG